MERVEVHFLVSISFSVRLPFLSSVTFLWLRLTSYIFQSSFQRLLTITITIEIENNYYNGNIIEIINIDFDVEAKKINLKRGNITRG